MYGAEIKYANGTGRGTCYACGLPIGKNQPTLRILSDSARARNGAIYRPCQQLHAIASECPKAIKAFHLKV